MQALKSRVKRFLMLKRQKTLQKIVPGNEKNEEQHIAEIQSHLDKKFFSMYFNEALVQLKNN